MQSLLNAARWELIVFVVAFGVVTLWRLLQDGSFAGLLRASDGTLSPGRIQMLVLTVMTAMQYLLSVIHDPTRFPSLPAQLVTALGGSQAIYLGAKAWTVFQDRNKKAEEK